MLARTENDTWPKRPDGSNKTVGAGECRLMPAHRWDVPLHYPKARMLDGPWGRYLVQRAAPRERWFKVTLNGLKTSYGGPTLIDSMKAVELVIQSNYQNVAFLRLPGEESR